MDISETFLEIFNFVLDSRDEKCKFVLVAL